MKLSLARHPHLRHHWELVDNASPGAYSRRCRECGKHKIASRRTARARREPTVESSRDVTLPGSHG